MDWSAAQCVEGHGAVAQDVCLNVIQYGTPSVTHHGRSNVEQSAHVSLVKAAVRHVKILDSDHVKKAHL